jgi:hypothetical protein
MSNPQAGWYPISSEPGMIRYWDGDQWTEHRQPRPGSDAAVAAEQQQSGAVYELESSTAQHAAAEAQHQAADAQRQAADAQRQAAAAAEQRHYAELNRQNLAAEAERTAASAAPAPQTSGTAGALWIVGFGLIVLIFSGVFIGQSVTPEKAGIGESQIAAKVVESAVDATGTCTPIVAFKVDGVDYTASYRLPAQACTVKNGDTLPVIYAVKNIQATSRIVPDASLNLVTLIAPAAGLAAVIGGVLAFLRDGGTLGDLLRLAPRLSTRKPKAAKTK